MNQRMTIDEIINAYPDQWVGLVDVEWMDEANVKTAVVKYTGMNSSDLIRMQIKDKGLYTLYTTPDNLAPLGIMGYMA